VRFIRRYERPKGLQLPRTAIGLLGILVGVMWFGLVGRGAVLIRQKGKGTANEIQNKIHCFHFAALHAIAEENVGERETTLLLPLNKCLS